MHRSRPMLMVTLILISVLAAPGVATAAVKTDSQALRNAVTVQGIMEHEQKFQDIADANEGTRASGTPGYTQSADYV
ncbi:hypothetical protein BH18ACT10_BH18ACT10_07150 [soil metagenome]